MSGEGVDRFRVVLVDDVTELRRLVRHVLESSERFEVVGEAADGRDAVELAEGLQPDLMLLDISMPVMDGMDALPRILEASPSTVVVMLSGFEAERLAKASLELGARAYIEKGTSPTALIAGLLEILGAPSTDPDRLEVGSPAEVHAGAGLLDDVSPEEMMALVAHEIRNPLAVIQGFGMELQNRWETMPDAIRLDAVTRMTERARYLNTVVNNLMYMRKLESAQAWIEPTEEDVGALLEQMQDELIGSARRHELKFELDAGLPPVKVDVARFRQVLANLIVNAAKFSPPGALIRLVTAPHERGVLVQVIDQGIGIPEAQREEVFDKFRRLDQSGSGIGLGLYISRALMASMGGEMWVEDAPSPGTCITCLLAPA
jgi:signal transduction histidine kinase